MSPEVTIVHVPRERYSTTKTRLESIIKHTQNVKYELLILDAGSPSEIELYLLSVANNSPNCRLIRFDYILTPNKLQNEAIKITDTAYIVFIDNDVVVTPNWLEPMINAAKERNAWVVGLTVLIGDVDNELIHLAGGDCHII